jgi:predicted nucleic acid-binding protein
MICLDSSFLGLLLHPTAKPPDDPDTGLPIERLEDRLNYLEERWAADHEKIILPTPVLSEFLVLAREDGAKYLDDIHASSHFIIYPFDEKAAVELAAIHLTARSTMSKRAKKRSDDDGTKAKMIFDRQIVAIAKVNGATAIYSDDKGVATFAKQNGLEVVQSWSLPLPAAQAVMLPFGNQESEKDEETAKIVFGKFTGGSEENIENKISTSSEAEIEAEDNDRGSAETEPTKDE